jgi:protein ImuB
LPPTFIKVWSVVPDGPPQRVQWNHEMRGIVRWWGPERIETGWWRGQQCRREYYRVELETGEWLWLFRRRPEGDWNLQGLFS